MDQRIGERLRFIPAICLELALFPSWTTQEVVMSHGRGTEIRDARCPSSRQIISPPTSLPGSWDVELA